jgi:hypothetical protein
MKNENHQTKNQIKNSDEADHGCPGSTLLSLGLGIDAGEADGMSSENNFVQV